MPRYLQKEDGFNFTLEDGSGSLLLEADWANEPGAGAGSWTEASDANASSWTKVSDSSSPTWTKEGGD